MNGTLRSFPIPSNDAARSGIVEAMALERRRDDPFFVHVTELARQTFNAPIAYVSLISGETQSLLHCAGADVEGTPREASLCAFTVAARETIVLHDTLRDPRSAGHPAVVDGFRLRFSASAPIILSTGFCLGTLCAVDMEPHDPPGAAQVSTLNHLAAMVARFFEAPTEPDPAQVAELRRIGEAAQEEFLALIGHELRTPLNGICGLAPLIEPADEEGAEIQAAIAASAELLERVVDNILYFTELRSGAIEIDEDVVDLAEILRSVVAAQSALIRAAGKSCDTSDLPERLSVRGDGGKLELALSCLLANFVIHGGSRGRIAAGWTSEGHVLLTIADDGAGIAPERERRIWQAFGTGQAVRTRQADGIGLGLPLARRLAELHGGDLELVHDAHGLTARLRLPAWRVKAPVDAVGSAPVG